MTSVNDLMHQIAAPSLTHEERARLRCQLAKSFEDTGNYESARKAMGELWSQVGQPPVLEGLSSAIAAEVLLRSGALTGWIGSVKQIEGSQEAAKNLLSVSINKFEAFRDEKKIAEEQTELGYCYWREGAFDEARVILHQAISRLSDEDNDLKAVALLRLAMVEEVTFRLSDALRLLPLRTPAEPRRSSLMFREPHEAAPTRVVRILHAEDDALVAAAVREALRGEGWRVSTYADGPSALGEIEGPEHYDLLIIDKQLPGADGLELVCPRARTAAPPARPHHRALGQRRRRPRGQTRGRQRLPTQARGDARARRNGRAPARAHTQTGLRRSPRVPLSLRGGSGRRALRGFRSEESLKTGAAQGSTAPARAAGLSGRAAARGRRALAGA